MIRLDAFLTVTDAAAFLGVSPNTVRNWGRDEKLKEYRHPVNNYRLYKQHDLERILKCLRQPVRTNAVKKRAVKQI